MKAEFVEKFIVENGDVINAVNKSVELPFSRVSARAIVVRQGDGAIMGTLHRQGGRYALPGGAVDDGESAATAIVRELKEENIILVGDDGQWPERVSVSYFGGYKELSVWYLFLVADAEIEPCEENIETRWIAQSEDVWYPFMREKILLMLNAQLPDLTQFAVSLKEM
jgi:ADP-ribose pyrophosphatase YjhB (NUDIX family)